MTRKILYTLSEAIAAAPEGWRVPSRDEWQELIDFAEGSPDRMAKGYAPTAGRKLKAASGWNECGNGTDELGFAALPDNYGNASGFLYEPGTNGIWWSCSPRLDEDGKEMENKIAVYGMYCKSNAVGVYDFDGSPALSVRLVKNDGVLPQNGVFTDPRDGKAYKCVRIGGKVWMAENLSYKQPEEA